MQNARRPEELTNYPYFILYYVDDLFPVVTFFSAVLFTSTQPDNFPRKLKKKVKLLIQIMLITFAAPRPNDPNVYGDWPWTNGGNTVGCSHNKVTQVGAILIIMVITEKGILVSAFIDR